MTAARGHGQHSFACRGLDAQGVAPGLRGPADDHGVDVPQMMDLNPLLGRRIDKPQDALQHEDNLGESRLIRESVTPPRIVW